MNETSSVTFIFSEVVSGFTNSDLTINGGVLTNVSMQDTGTRYTATFEPSTDTESPNTVITLKSGMVQDSVGNLNLGDTNSPNYAIDTKAPTLNITSNVSTLKAGEVALITFTFSEALYANSFVESDAAHGSGTWDAGTFKVDPTNSLVYTATFRPTDGLASGTASITVAAGAYQDAAGNAGIAAPTPAITIDTLRPTLSSITVPAQVNATATPLITFSFSEALLAGTFTADDVAITGAGGSLGTVSGSGATYYATYTPPINTASGTVTFTVAANQYLDSNGNLNTAVKTQTFDIDTVAPTVGISTTSTALKSTETAVITFTFSEDPGTTFIKDDITAIGGTMTALTNTGLIRTFTFTPTPTTLDAGSTASISVPYNYYTDSFLNPGAAGSLATTLAIDTKAPTLSITSSAGNNTLNLTSRTTSTITFTFSEAPVGFDWDPTGVGGDIVIAGGTLGAFTGSGSTRTAIFTPTLNQEGPATASITVAGGSYTDAAFNTGGGGQTIMNIDTKAPDALSGTYSGDGNTTINKTEAAAGFAISGSVASDVSVSLGSLAASLYSVSYGAPSGGVRTWTLNIPTATISSTIFSEGATRSDTLVSTDLAGNTASAALNIYKDTTVPTLSITRSGAGTLKAGETSVVTFAFSEALLDNSFVWADVAVTGTAGGTLGPLSQSLTDPKVYTATFAPADGQNAGSNTISVAATKYQDAAGNDNSAASNTLTINYDTKAPTLTITNSAGNNTLNLTTLKSSTISFTFSEAVTGFDSSDITVSGGTLGTLSWSSGIYAATFTPTTGQNAPAQGTVTVAGGAASYTDAAGNPGGAGSTPTINIDTLAPAFINVTSYSGTGTDNYLGAADVTNASPSFTISGTKDADASLVGIGATPTTYSGLAGSPNWSIMFNGPQATSVFGSNGIKTLTLRLMDSAGNTSDTLVPIRTDLYGPKIMSITAAPDLLPTDAPTIVFGFNENPGNSFTASDVQITGGGTLDAVTGSGFTRSAVYHPADPLNPTAVTFTLAATNYTDIAGNLGTNTMAVTLAAPTHSDFSTPGKALALVDVADYGIQAGATVYDANATDNGGTIVYTLKHVDDWQLFSINESTGAVSFAGIAHFADPHGPNYQFTVTATGTDPVHTADQAVTLTLVTPAIQPEIPVFLDAACSPSLAMGKLILPVSVDAGCNFYYWDRDGSGNNSGDNFSYDTLTQIFKYSSTGVLNPDLETMGMSATYRYGTLYTTGGKALQVALPTVGAYAYADTVNGIMGTGIGAPVTFSLGDTSNNPQYNDLAAIVDAYNGAVNQVVGMGMPTGWANSSSSFAAADRVSIYYDPLSPYHSLLDYTGRLTTVNNTVTDNSGSGYHVALQVL